MQEIALRSALASNKVLIVDLAGESGKPPNPNRLDVEVASADPDTGALAGKGWQGQLTGTVFSFKYARFTGSLSWDAEARAFRGPVQYSNHAFTGVLRPM